MAFLYLNANIDELTDKEMIADVLITHEKISRDIKEILLRTGIIETTSEALDKYNSALHDQVQALARVFVNACLHEFFDRDRSLINIDDDYCMACMTYENFAHTHLSGLVFKQSFNESTHLRLKDKYQQYNHSTEQWYDFYMLPIDKKIELLVAKRREE